MHAEVRLYQRIRSIFKLLCHSVCDNIVYVVCLLFFRYHFTIRMKSVIFICRWRRSSEKTQTSITLFRQVSSVFYLYTREEALRYFMIWTVCFSSHILGWNELILNMMRTLSLLAQKNIENHVNVQLTAATYNVPEITPKLRYHASILWHKDSHIRLPIKIENSERRANHFLKLFFFLLVIVVVVADAAAYGDNMHTEY